jgi:hypothetical protein
VAPVAGSWGSIGGGITRFDLMPVTAALGGELEDIFNNFQLNRRRITCAGQ